MMTRVFLAAGVAAMAIAAPASAKPGGGHGGGQSAQEVQHGGGGGQRAERQSVQRQSSQRAERPQRAERQQQRFAQRTERPQQQQRVAQRTERPQRVERQEQRLTQRAERPQRIERQQQRVAQRTERVNHADRIERQQVRMTQQNRIDRNQARIAERQIARDNRVARIDNRIVERGANRIAVNDVRLNHGANARAVGFGLGGCPPGLASKGCMPPGQALQATRIANADAFRYSRLAALTADPRTRFLAPTQVVSYVGSPLSALSNTIALSALPRSVSYLYPDTNDYYYRYGDGYVYRVERNNNLIDWILPALAGGFLPGQYLPTSYMNSYVPNYYGFNSFYPSSYGQNYGYGYGYDNLCNRYANGVIYQVDCYTGMIQDVVPLYASGYGVGQMLPASYGTYNVPYQYRDVYYNTPDYNYWYAPGAIYQVDPSTSLISSVAALLTPGFSVGQPLPAGYGVYNVPYGYRSTYYDTPNAWYRYNNGYIYQVDPTTQLVTAIVASILT
jgi:hypothetical protein